MGHFQKLEWGRMADAEKDKWGGVDKVFRRTGGGAILHDCELTYSIVIPERSGGKKGHSEELYRGVHDSVVQGLRELGLDAHFYRDCLAPVGPSDAKQCEFRIESEPFLCFARRTPLDVVVNGHKVLGSAQRRGAHGILQHGSLLLRASPWTPQLLGIIDLMDRREKVDWGVRGTERFDAYFSKGADFWDLWTQWLGRRLEIGLMGL
jgi:lipoate-protein ligase A